MNEDSGIPMESGRIVIVPKRRLPRGPMAEGCARVAVPSGKVYVTPYYVPVEGHPGTSGLRRLRVTVDPPAGSVETVHVIVAHAPFLVIGDHSFVYPRASDAMSEPARALRACEGSRRSGTYRADSDDVGVCLRTGWKRGVVQLQGVQGGFACECEPETEPSEA